MSDELLSDLEVREQSLANTRDALAALQKVPAAGLDDSKYETISRMVDDARSLERALQNEVEQMRGEADE
ncbi:hypothetical protein JMJ58_14975 [Haloterrigena salifodinae]|uniref:Uncharacterized protein n=1 Tax=Haloterrigena salifodinae TaxID=2675099 RepID=A0A8T8DXZ4_9EURY|nr:hypothetical protein [Haloterrigena salifodinae]QRV14237.1 hypothetical protein JMJ58_14975 [Haloterrigena salifodinae]